MSIIEELENEFNKNGKKITHIFLKQRTGRKFTASIQDLPDNMSTFMTGFKCGGSLTKDKNGNTVIILQGDQRENVKNFLITKKIQAEDEIKIHGF